MQLIFFDEAKVAPRQGALLAAVVTLRCSASAEISLIPTFVGRESSVSNVARADDRVLPRAKTGLGRQPPFNSSAPGSSPYEQMVPHPIERSRSCSYGYDRRSAYSVVSRHCTH